MVHQTTITMLAELRHSIQINEAITGRTDKPDKPDKPDKFYLMYKQDKQASAAEGISQYIKRRAS